MRGIFIILAFVIQCECALAEYPKCIDELSRWPKGVLMEFPSDWHDLADAELAPADYLVRRQTVGFNENAISLIFSDSEISSLLDAHQMDIADFYEQIIYNPASPEQFDRLRSLRNVLIELDEQIENCISETEVVTPVTSLFENKRIALARLKSIHKFFLSRFSVALSENDPEELDAFFRYLDFLIRGRQNAVDLVDELTWNIALKRTCGDISKLVSQGSVEDSVLARLVSSLGDLTIREVGIEEGLKEDFRFLGGVIDQLTRNPAVFDEKWGIKDFPRLREIVLHPNRTKRTYWSYTELAIRYGRSADMKALAELRDRSCRLRDLENVEGAPLRNMVGELIAMQAFPHYEKTWREAWITFVHYQLVKTVIERELGLSSKLVDPLSQREWEYGPGGLPFSIGFDRLANTDDDIKIGDPWP
jgi:hypothetical protein